VYDVSSLSSGKNRKVYKISWFITFASFREKLFTCVNHPDDPHTMLTFSTKFIRSLLYSIFTFIAKLTRSYKVSAKLTRMFFSLSTDFMPCSRRNLSRKDQSNSGGHSKFIV